MRVGSGEFRVRAAGLGPGGSVTHETTITHTNERAFRVLQLTDFHNDQGRELAERTYRDVRAMVQRYSPDFLAVTGDIWCGDSLPGIAPSLRMRDLRFLASLEIPWAFCWGNHDYVGDFGSAQAEIRRSKNALMPDSDANGNYRVAVQNGTGRVLWDIYFLNSKEFGLLYQDVAWLEAESRRIAQGRGYRAPAVVFFHIPLRQYEDARLMEEIQGIGLEEVLFYDDDGTLLRELTRCGCVRACFAGHSHVNDFYFQRDGVVLAYGRATGHGGYGGDRLAKGAKLIYLESNGAFAFESVFAEGPAWGRAEFAPEELMD